MAAIELPVEYIPHNGDELLVSRPHGYEVDRYVGDRWQGSRVTDALYAKWLASDRILLFEGEGYWIYRKARFVGYQRVKVIRTQQEIIIDVPRSDLRPEIMIYEAKTPGGKFAGFYREDEIEPLTEMVTERQWDDAIHRAVRANLKERGTSPSEATISNRMGPAWIVEVRSGEKTMLVKEGWRQAIKACQ
jgi:hypothetical protein